MIQVSAITTRPNLPEGFTAIPHKTFDRLLCLDLSKRELLILLLVARLSFGCRSNGWIRLRQVDLQAVGIGATHARECLDSLLHRGLLLQHGYEPEFRLGNLAGEEASRRRRRLEKLIGRQLAQASQNRNSAKPSLTTTGTQFLPNEELSTYPNGKKTGTSGWQFDRSQSRFVKEKEASDRYIIDKYK